MVRWPDRMRDLMAADAAEETADEIDPRLPLVAEARERDRLARARLRVGGASVDPPARRDHATSIAEAEFAAARGRRRRR